MADNQVILEGVARFEALQRALDQLVSGAENSLNKLGKAHPLVVDVARAKVEVDSILNRLRQLATQTAAPKILRVNGINEATAQVQSLISRVAQLGPAFKEFGPADPLGPFRTSVNQAQSAVYDFVTRTTSGSSTFGKALESAATRSKVALDQLAKEIRDAAAAGSPIPAAAVAQVDRLENEYRQATTAAKNFRGAQDQVRDSIRGSRPQINLITESIQRATTAVKSFIVYAAVSELRKLGGESFTASEKLKAIHRQFEAVFGSSKRAADEFAFVRSESLRLGLDLSEMAASYIKVATASERTSLAGEGTRKLFTSLAEGATVGRLSTDDFALVLRAFTQILGGPTVRLEELTQQLRDTLPQSYGIAIEAGKRMNIEQGRFRDAVTDSLLDSGDFAKKFGEVWREQVGKQVPEASKSATAAMGRFSTASFEAKAAAGDQLSPAVAALATDFSNLLSEEKPTVEFIGKIVSGFLTLARVGLASATATRESLGAIAAGFQAVAAAAIPGGAGFSEFFEIAKERINKAKKSLDDLEKSLFPAAGALNSAAGAADNLADSSTNVGNQLNYAQRKVEAGFKAVDALARALPETGEIQRAVADKIVKAIDKQLVAIRSLPIAEQAAFTERTQAIEELRKRVFEFTTAYEKEQKKQEAAAEALAKKEASALRQRTEQFESFLRGIKKLADAAIEEQRGTGGEEIAKTLAEQRAELAKLREQPQLSAEDQARADQLDESIAKLERDFKRVGNTGATAGALAGAGLRQVGKAAGDATKAFREGVLDAVSSSEEFRAVFNNLGADGQASLRGLVEGILAVNDAGQLSSATIQNFLTGFARYAEQAGVTADGFIERIRGMVGLTDSISSAFVALKSNAEPAAKAFALLGENAAGAKSSIADLGSSATTAAGGVTNMGSALTTIASSLPALSLGFNDAQFAAEALGGSSEAVQGALSDVVLGVDLVSEAMTQQLAASQENAEQADTAAVSYLAFHDAADRAGQGVFTVADASQRAGDVFLEAGGKVIELGEKAKEGAGQIGGIAVASQDAAKGLQDTGAAADSAAIAADKAGTAAKTVADNLDDTAKAADTAASQLPRLADAQAQVAKTGKDAGEGVGALNKSAGEALEPVGKLLTELGKVPGLKLPDIFSHLATDLGKGGTEAGKLAEGIGKVEKAATDGNEELEALGKRGKEIAEAWGKADTALSGFNERAEIAIGLCKELETCLAGGAA
jgi:hypothetical protein